VRADSIGAGRKKDDEDYQTALVAYSETHTAWAEKRTLARGVLAGDQRAFSEAIAELNPFADIEDLSISVTSTVHSSTLVECVVLVKGTEIIPTEVKTLTTSGKVSTKAMAKGRFHEIFQDYVCGCVLRIAREIFALVPAHVVLVTAVVDDSDEAPGSALERSVLSAVIPRATLNGLDCNRIDPSDAMDAFQHRGDVRLSRKTGEFVTIVPISPNEIPQEHAKSQLADPIADLRRIRDDIAAQTNECVLVIQSTGRKAKASTS
jgi:hypothetical protein